MSEELVKWLVVSGLVLVIVVWQVVARSAEKRRRQHFAKLAAHFGASVESVGDRTLHFESAVDEREFEIRDGYRGGGLGVETSATRYFTVATPLRGRSWDLHDVKITPRRLAASEFDKRFKVEEFGMRLPDRWLNDDVRAGITSLASDFKPEILIEQGNLVFRSMAAAGDFAPERLAEVLKKQATLAGALEFARN